MGKVLAVIAVVIGLINWYSTPTMMDDLLYRFVWQPDFDQPFEPVTSLDDVVRSQEIHYWSNSGRVIVHAVAQTMLNLVPPQVTKLVNAAMFIVLMVLVVKVTETVRVSCSSHSARTVTLALAFAMTFLLLQGFCMGFVWLIGAFNYLWPLVVNLCFYLAFRAAAEGRVRWWQLTCLLPLSLLAGWTHEALAVPVSAALLLWLFRHRRHILHQSFTESDKQDSLHSLAPATCCALAYMLGLAMILLSPALWNRAGENGIDLQHRLMNGVISLALNVRISWLLIVTLAVLWRKKRFAGILYAHGYFLTAWAIAFGIVAVCGELVERVAIYADFLAMLALLRIWQGEWLLRHRTVVTSAAVAVSVIAAIPVVALNRENYAHYTYHCQQLRQSGTHIIKIRQMASSCNFLETRLKKQFVYPNVEFDVGNSYMPFDRDDLEPRLVACLYGKDTVTMLPEDVVEKMEKDSTAYTRWEADAHGKLLVWQLSATPGKVARSQVHRVTFLLGDEEPLPFYLRWSTYPEYEYELDSRKHKVVTVRGRDYLVMTMPVNKIRRRIKDIRVE